MPGGQGGGGGWARPTAGEASSISGRNANTTADTALRCSQGFIGHLLSVAFCVEILRFVRCPGARIGADGGDHGNDGAGLHAGSAAQLNDLLLLAARAVVHRGAAVARRLGWQGSDLTSSSGIRDFCVVTWEGFGPTLQWRICLRALASGLIVCPHKVQGALPPRSRE